MLNHTVLLKEVAQDKRHTFISTGMSTIEEIEKAVEIFEQKNCSYELMHCVSTYPMDPQDANLKCISWCVINLIVTSDIVDMKQIWQSQLLLLPLE